MYSAIDPDNETSNNKPRPPRIPVGQDRERGPAQGYEVKDTKVEAESHAYEDLGALSRA